jgi:hypothetical protein
MSQDGLHGLRPGRSRCAAGLVAAYEQAAVVNRRRETMLKTMMMIVIGATLALLALTPATEARKAGGTQQEKQAGP